MAPTYRSRIMLRPTSDPGAVWVGNFVLYITPDGQVRLRDAAGSDTPIGSDGGGSAATGEGPPSGAPAGLPLYFDTENDALYVWDGAAWRGPYVTAS